MNRLKNLLDPYGPIWQPGKFTFLCYGIAFGLLIATLTAKQPDPVLVYAEDILVQSEHREEVVPCHLIPDCVKLAEAMYFEARGEGKTGMVAVGHVVLNRVNSPYFKNSVKEVIDHGCHFSYTCDRRVKHRVGKIPLSELPLDHAHKVFHGLVPDPTNGANHYLRLDQVKRIPVWAKVYEQTVQIGNHTFYRRG